MSLSIYKERVLKFLLGLVFMVLSSVNITADDRALVQVFKKMKSEPRVALVIGNNNYQKPFSSLNNTINDAKAMKNILETRGFKVIYKTNVTKREFDESLEEFYQEIRRGSMGLLYFSGHGLESNGDNYLIPIDAKIKAKSDTQYEAIALNKVTARMQSENDKLNIVILDACRNDPFAKAMGVGGLAKAEPPVGLFVSYATKAGKVSSDGRLGGNGLFTTYLIKYMQEPLSFKDVFQKAREAVYKASNKAQFPAIYDNTINVNFYFTLPNMKQKEDVVVTPVANDISDNSKLWALEKACKLGDGESCNSIGYSYEYEKRGLAKDLIKAVIFYKKACDLNNGWGCNNLGHSYQDGEGGLQKNIFKGIELFKRACDLNNGSGCTSLGYRYKNGFGIEQDLSKAFIFHKKACDLNCGTGCYNLGLLYQYGDGVTKNLSKAKIFYKKACDLNYAKGCSNFATY